MDDTERSIKGKLRHVLRSRGMRGEELDDAWMLTMPSYFGFEGINPLTMYFCYGDSGAPLAIIFEVSSMPDIP